MEWGVGMFAVNAAEALVLTVWLAGVLAALYAGPSLPRLRHRVGLLVAALILPILGSVLAITTAAAVRLNARQGAPADGKP